jgi:hypothetical protein
MCGLNFVIIQGRSRMREIRTYGSVRGAVSNDRPYRDNIGAIFLPAIFLPTFCHMAKNNLCLWSRNLLG